MRKVTTTHSVTVRIEQLPSVGPATMVAAGLALRDARVPVDARIVSCALLNGRTVLKVTAEWSEPAA